MRQTIGNAVLDVEGDEAAIIEAARMFHLTLAEQALREVNDKLAALRPLQQHKRTLQKTIADLKTMALPTVVDAVDPTVAH